MKRCIAVVVIAWLGLSGRPLSAQRMLSGDGWEGFTSITYMGGDSTLPKRMNYGMLVITDTTLALHQCAQHYRDCTHVDKITKLPFDERAIISIPLTAIRKITTSSQTRGPDGAERLIAGFLASDHSDDLIGISYDTATSAEAPLFKTIKTHLGAIEAKLRFRLKKLGIELP